MSCPTCKRIKNLIRHLLRFILAVPLIIFFGFVGGLSVLMFKLGDFIACVNMYDDFIEDFRVTIKAIGEWILFRGEDC